MRLLWTLGIMACVLTPGLAWAANGAAADAGYHLLKTLPLPGDKGWDYSLADSQARRLYVTHGDRVMVLDLDSNTLVGEVGPFQGIHGVALDPNLGRGYVSDGKAGAVVCFDLKTLKILKVIPGRPDADGIVFDPASGRVFAFNGDDRSATVIDAQTNTVVKTLALGGKPEFNAVDGKGLLFVNLVDKDRVLTIDTQDLKIIRRSPVAPGQHPAAMSLDVEGGNLFVGCRNQRAIILDPATGKIKGDLPIGERVDASVYDPGTKTEFHSCGDGSVWVAQKGADGVFHNLAPIPTQRGSRTLALDLKTHDLYLSSADFGPAPAPTKGKRHPWPKLLPGTFAVLVFGKN